MTTLLLALAGTLFCEASPLVEQVVWPAVAIRLADRPYGSGTVIDYKGKTYVLTAAHCCEHLYQTEERSYLDKDGNLVLIKRRVTKELDIVTRRGKVESKRTAKLLWYDKDTDLALLSVDARGLTSAKVPDKDVEVEPGELAWACGSGAGVEFNLVRTSVAKVEDAAVTTNGKGLFFGHSGSGLFVKRDCCGTRYVLAGVVVRGHSPYATFVESVPLSAILTFLKDYSAYAAQDIEAGPSPREER